MIDKCISVNESNPETEKLMRYYPMPDVLECTQITSSLLPTIRKLSKKFKQEKGKREPMSSRHLLFLTKP